MHTQLIAGWAVVVLLVMATILDLRYRRIPNWLVLPFLMSGVIVNTAVHGWKGLTQSMESIALAAAVMGILCLLGGMGWGDLKLCAAVGAWMGPGQMVTALVLTGLAGGALALIWAAFHGTLGDSLDGSSELLSGFLTKEVRRHPRLTLGSPSARTMPYAPAIAIGAVFSFFAT